MSAFRRAVLSVAPERLEQFTNEMKKNISEKDGKKRKSKREHSSMSSSEHKRRKTTSGPDKNSSRSKSSTETSKERGVKKRGGGRKKASSRSRSKERKRSHKSTSDKKRHGEKRKKPNDDSDFCPKDLDLSVPLLPLSKMVKDRNAMLETAFLIIKGPKLTSMLPDILKLTPLEDIKQLCEEQLTVMSSKRILHILAGTEMESSSGTDSSDDGRSGTRVRAIPTDVKNAESSQDRSLQANLIDSTTSDHSGPSMLFPSALSTALSTSEGSSIPARQINNGRNEDDNVSTSTEPNLIYAEGSRDDQTPSSDTEEGEVQTSAEESGGDEQSGTSDVEEVELLKEHPGEEVFVEEEEIEEIHEEEQIRSTHHEPAAEEVKQNLDEDTGGNTQLSSATQNEVTDTVADPAQTEAYAGKSQLEILELELRARAIRSLMNAAKSGKLKPAQ